MGAMSFHERGIGKQRQVRPKNPARSKGRPMNSPGTKRVVARLQGGKAP